MKTMIVLVLLLALAVLMPEVAHACESCFGSSSDSDTVRGISLAMASLLAVTGFIWGGIGMFFLNMRRRAKRLEPGHLIVNEYGEIRERDN